MVLPSSGQISLNQIHVEAGGTTETQSNINSAANRGLISEAEGNTASNPLPFSLWYGAESGGGGGGGGSGAAATGEHWMIKGGSTYVYETFRSVHMSPSKDHALVVEQYFEATTQSVANSKHINMYLFEGNTFDTSKKLTYAAANDAGSGSITRVGKNFNFFVDDDAIYIVHSNGQSFIYNGSNGSNATPNKFHIIKVNHSFTEQWSKEYTESGTGLYWGETITRTNSTTTTLGSNYYPGSVITNAVDDEDYIYISTMGGCSVYKISKSDGSVSAKQRFSRGTGYQRAITGDGFASGSQGVFPAAVVDVSAKDKTKLICQVGHTGKCVLNKSDLSIDGSIRYSNINYVTGSGSFIHYSTTAPMGIVDDPSNGDFYTMSQSRYYDLKNPVDYVLIDKVSTSGTVSWTKYFNLGSILLNATLPLGVDSDGFYLFGLQHVSPEARGIIKINKSTGAYASTPFKKWGIRNDADTGYINNYGSLFYNVEVDRQVARIRSQVKRRHGSNGVFGADISLYPVVDGDASTSDDYGAICISDSSFSSWYSTSDYNGFQLASASPTLNSIADASTSSSEPSWGTVSSASIGITASNATSGHFSLGTAGTARFLSTAATSVITGTN